MYVMKLFDVNGTEYDVVTVKAASEQQAYDAALNHFIETWHLDEDELAEMEVHRTALTDSRPTDGSKFVNATGGRDIPV